MATRLRARVVSSSAPHRVHEPSGARAGLGDCRQGCGLARVAAVGGDSPRSGPNDGDLSAATFEQDVTLLPLVEVIVTRRGVWQQLQMAARCGPGPDRLHGQEPLAREPSPGSRDREQILGHLRRRSAARVSPRNTGCAGPRTACSTRRTPRRQAPTVMSPGGEGTPTSRLAAPMAPMRIFVRALPASACSRVARKRRNSQAWPGSQWIRPPRRIPSSPTGWDGRPWAPRAWQPGWPPATEDGGLPLGQRRCIATTVTTCDRWSAPTNHTMV